MELILFGAIGFIIGGLSGAAWGVILGFIILIIAGAASS